MFACMLILKIGYLSYISEHIVQTVLVLRQLESVIILEMVPLHVTDTMGQNELGD